MAQTKDVTQPVGILLGIPAGAFVAVIWMVWLFRLAVPVQ